MAIADRYLEAEMVHKRYPAAGPKTSGQNVGRPERWASTLGGAALALYGVTRRSPGGWAAALLGGGLVYRGVTGHCPVYAATGVNAADGAHRPIHVEEGVIINRPPEELYRFWRDLENLPRFMRHLEAVTVTGLSQSHWVARAPMGRTVEWDAQITEERENEQIHWRSLPGAAVDNRGAVRFIRRLDGRGTEVRVSLDYLPPAGPLGAAIAKLFGEEPGQQIHEDMRRFKQLMEAGEIATVEGQPRG